MLTRGRSIKPSVKLAAVLFAFGVFLTTMTGTSSSPAAAMQIGATASSLSNGYGLKGVIGQPNTFVGGNLGRAYWIAVTFDNHDFFQAGFLDAGRDYSGENFCHTGFSTFVTGLNGNQNLLPGLYNPEHCGLTGTHTFRLDISRSTPQYVFWQWYLDGSPIGPSLQEPYYVNHFARANAGAISELVKVGDADGTEQFPNVHYSLP